MIRFAAETTDGVSRRNASSFYLLPICLPSNERLRSISWATTAELCHYSLSLDFARDTGGGRLLEVSP